MRSHDVTIATCQTLPEPDPDQAPLLTALDAAGLRARLCAWNDPDVDWAAAPVTIIRSTWDYYKNRDAFVAWARRIEDLTDLHNPAHIVAWNSHKRYLLELADAGLPVVPTMLVPAGSDEDPAALVDAHDWERFVVKPAISAGSYETHVMRRDAPDLETLARLLRERDVLIQPFVASVQDYGERSIVCIDGEITHSIRKHPRFAGEQENVTGPHPVDDAERRLAHDVLDHLGESLLYARIDLARDASGAPMLMELEILEPSLFFRFSERALTRYVEAVRRQV